MRELTTPRLTIRNWQERDRPLFHRINSDDRVMEFFPMRRDRDLSDSVMDRMRAEIERDGVGWTAVEITETGVCIGFVGLSRSEIAPAAPSGTMEIGWRLAPEFWGKGYVTEASVRLLDYAFDHLGEEEIISFAVLANHRSIAVMERLGMVRSGEFDNSRVPGTHPRLVRHVLYKLSRETWRAQAHRSTKP